MKYFFVLFFSAVFFICSCESGYPEQECLTYLDCTDSKICVEGVCVEDEKSFVNDDKDVDPVSDNEKNPVPDENEDEVENPDEDNNSGGGKCEKDSDCDDGDDCTDNSCASGYCVNSPKIETCNGNDDNCNGEVDEWFEGMGDACDTGLDGKCSNGTLVCLDGEVICQSPYWNEPELCNGEDDNCDGFIDKFKPEEMPDCPLQFGVCAGSKKVCDGTQWLECTDESYGELYSEEDELDTLFLDTNCDGVDGIVENQIFVDGLIGDDLLNDGSIENPYKTINKGIEEALLRELEAVIIAEGLYEESVEVPSDIGLYGGFQNHPEWIGSTENETIISGYQKGAEIIDSQNSKLLNLTIISADLLEGEGSSYGLFVANSSDIEIVNCKIIGGAGGKGVDGKDGGNGTTGGTGGKGVKGCEDSGGFCGSCSRPAGGISGKNNSCLMHGGTGGQPGNGSSHGSPGKTAVNGGGTGGLGGIHYSSGNKCTSTSTSAVYSKGSDGSAGIDGDDGEAGIAGFFSEAGFNVLKGGDGTDATHGKGGGGGGGGRGGVDYCDSYGSSGGGGGAGGCGGIHGKGGAGGGGSIGIFLAGSQNIKVIDSQVVSSNGGDGGIGGHGGEGGKGGAGGAGGEHSGSGEQDDGGCGGWGGEGGAGGNGGHGGGGAGGPSFGIVQITSDLIQSGIDFTVGEPGLGGVSDGFDGIDGETGEFLEVN
jgi:hypothetical protein